MESQHLTYFKVENFKRFDALEVNDIGQFNLIVGDNNVGKTSLLEALLVDDSNYYQCLYNLVSALSNIRKIPAHGLEQIANSDYLSFYLKIGNKPLKFQLVTQDANTSLEIASIKKNQLSQEELTNLGAKNIIHSNSNHLAKFSKNGASEMIYCTINNSIENFSQYYPIAHFGLAYHFDVVDFFSQIARFPENKKFLLDEIKKYYLSTITDIQINNSIVSGFSVLTLAEENMSEVRPISSYGDGLNKFFRYLLEIFKCENARLMIDEIDTGIYYSKMKENFKSLFHLAKQNKVQLFATTHSKECLQYYKEAIAELKLENEARVIAMIETKNKDIKAITYKFEEFEHSLNHDNELR